METYPRATGAPAALYDDYRRRKISTLREYRLAAVADVPISDTLGAPHEGRCDRLYVPIGSTFRSPLPPGRPLLSALGRLFGQPPTPAPQPIGARAPRDEGKSYERSATRTTNDHPCERR